MTPEEEREKEWWQSWWEKDFSWDHLPEWARTCLGIDEGKLVQGPNGKRYHPAHLPFAWPDGTPTEKASWTDDQHEALAQELEECLQRAFDNDREADLRGVVLKVVPHMPPAREKGNGGQKTIYGASVRFYHAWLTAETAWSDQVFGACSFSAATFSGVTVFSSVTFAGDALFPDATFSGDALFPYATFSGDALFSAATFAGRATFSAATFSEGALFSTAIFAGGAVFNAATFSAAARFEATTLYRDAWFSAATFSGDASFPDATFAGQAFFGNATFAGDAWFPDATFKENAWFDGETFTPRDPSLNLLSFARARFEKSFSFTIAGMTNYTHYCRRAFHSARFEGNLYTELSEEKRRALVGKPVAFPVGAFDGALLQELVFLDKDYAARKDSGIPEFVQQQIDSTKTLSPEEREENLNSIVEGARVLQIAMSKGRNHQAEQLFHKIELIAMRETRVPHSPLRILTDAYERTSDFGGSTARPLGWTIGVALFCAAIYWIQSFNLGPDCRPPLSNTCAWDQATEQIVPALTFSANSTFRPAYAISREERIANDFERRILFGKGWKGALRAAFLGTLSTLQSLFSIVMLFLTGLAARRRFQLS